MPEPQGVTAEEAAAELGIHRNTLTSWFKKGAPRNPDGSVNPELVREWKRLEDEARTPNYDDTAKRSLQGADVGQSSELKRWMLEYRKAKALMAVLEVRQRKGELIELSESKRRRVALCSMFRQELMALAARLSHRLHGREPAEIHKIIDDEARRVLKSLVEGPATDEVESDA